MPRRLPLLALLLASSLACARPGAEDGSERGDEIGSESGSDSESSTTEGGSSESESSTTEGESAGSDTDTDTGSDTDTGTGSDTETGTSTDTDTGSDTGGPQEFAALIGECPQLDVELEAPTPSLHELHLDFRGDPFDDPEDIPLLTEGGQIIYTTPNEGGSSVVSETFAFEVLTRCEGAELLATETEILYLDDMGKKTDILVDFEGLKIGVSVTRAVGFPPEDPYPEAQALSLIQGKLEDVLLSSANVAPEHEWSKQILVVMAYADMHAELVAAAWAGLDPAIQADTVVYLVTTDGMDTPIYFE